jgi:hypothetical protein
MPMAFPVYTVEKVVTNVVYDTTIGLRIVSCFPGIQPTTHIMYNQVNEFYMLRCAIDTA